MVAIVNNDETFRGLCMRPMRIATRESRMGLFRLSFLSCALLAAAPASAQEPSMWDKMMNTVGLGGNPAPSPAAPQPAAPQSAQPAAPAQPAQPGFMDGVMGKIGFDSSGPAIDYSERRKLAVPQQRVLPKPNPAPERQVASPAQREETLVKPPSEYLTKVPGEDGQVSGLRDGDTSKEKKFFGLF
jgi:hypothetical protein